MSPESKTVRTLNTLIRVGRALRDPHPDSGTPDEPAGMAGSVGRAARRVAGKVSHSPRVQEVAQQLQELRSEAGVRADQRLQALIEEARARRGQIPPDEVTGLLQRRRQEREEKLAQARARQQLLAQAQNDAQRRVLILVAASTSWAGGEASSLRYTQVLDQLAPGESPAAELALHRALWTLAERRILAISPHGVVTAVQTLPPASPASLPGS